MESQPPIVMKMSDVTDILNNINESNFLGKGAAGAVYRFDYYNIQAVVKIPVNETKKENIKEEIVVYNHLCKIFDKCQCRNYIVQMLGYNMKNSIIMLEYFDGSDLTKYTGYPVSELTYLTHRLLPKSSINSNCQGNCSSIRANLSTLRKYQRTSTDESTLLTVFNKVYIGLLCLHNNGIYHKDFELKNILVSTNGKIGITDFGLSRVINGEYLSYGYDTIFDGFLRDISTLGPMIGNFLDSSNPEPYQYRLDSGHIDNKPILDKISDHNLKDLFLLLTSFQDLVAFVSFIYYMNKNLDFITGENFIKTASILANSLIEELPFDNTEKEMAYVRRFHISMILDTVYNNLISEPGFTILILYFRSIINQMFTTAGISNLLSTESVHDYIKRVFSDSYDVVIVNLSNQLKYGFLLRHFDIFSKLYQPDNTTYNQNF